MNYKNILLLTLTIPALTAFGQGQPPVAPPSTTPATQPRVDRIKPPMAANASPTVAKAAPQQAGRLQDFAFEGAPIEVVLEEYCRWTGKIYLKTDDVKASITLKADKLTTEESIKVVEAILAMNNIALVPMGDKYIKVILATAGDLTGQGLDINMDQQTEYGNTDRFVTQIIQLKNVEIPEVQAAVQHVMHSYGKIMSLQRSNSLMITDTEANIKRAREIIEFIDQATAQIEPKIYHIEHADASEIASKLNEIVTAAQGDQKKTAGKTSSSTARTPPGVIRPGSVRGAAAKKAPTKATIDQTEGGTKTIIHGTVKIISDDRTNIIIIFSQEENFAFFEKIIQVLDIIVDPTIKFEVIGLEYADAVELSGTLNDLVGAATGGGSSRSSAGSSRTSSSASNSRTSSSSRTSNKRTSPTGNRSSSNSSQVTPNASPSAVSAIDNLARLSENTKILADERSNSVILMGEKADIAALKIVIKSLDIMLEQVVIEAAIFEIGLDDNLRHGIDWIYGKQGDDRIGSWDGQSILTNSLESVVSGALSYYMNVPGIDSKFLVNVSKTDTNARLVSTPVIMTTDNTEATLSIGEKRPVVTSTSSYANSSGTRSSQYEYKDIGIQLTVTPRINPQRFVVMELSQKADSLGGNVLIDGNEVPVIKNREFDASIAVPDGGTVVLGGLISTETVDSVNKIPILGDIPLIGRYLFSSVSKVDAQRELIVLMTPYVMSDQKEMIEQSERLYEGTSLLQEDWTGSWSESKLRQIPDPPEDLGDEEKKEEK